MSDTKTMLMVPEPNTDLTEIDLEKINAFREAGMPGLVRVDDVMLTRIMELYLSGKSYNQISKTLNLNKAIILHLAHKFDWFTMRKEYLIELEASIQSRVMEARVVNQDFLLQLIHMWQKKIGNNITKYLATDNPEFANNIDPKDVDKYLKTVEILHKLSSDKGSAGSTPAVGLNVGDGVSIVKTGDNSVEITPKQRAVEDMLKQFADARREEESKKK